MSTAATTLTVNASHVAKILSQANHPKAAVTKPKGFGVLHEAVTQRGFQVFTLDDGRVAVALRETGDDEPSEEIRARMLAGLSAYKPALKAAGFHGTVERMERTLYPYIRLNGRDAVVKAPAETDAVAAEA